MVSTGGVSALVVKVLRKKKAEQNRTKEENDSKAKER
jgi:uncharacterized protein YoaH (UPF0181 family)